MAIMTKGLSHPRNRTLRFVAFFLLVGMLLLISQYLYPALDHPRFLVTSNNMQDQNSSPEFYHELLPSAQEAPSVHAASIIDTPQGLLAVWFGGSQEGKRDVKIYLSRHTHKGWSRPRPIAGRLVTQKGTKRFTRMTGNPVIYTDLEKEKVFLMYVSVGTVGGWSGSALNLMVSVDGGRNFSLPKRLVTAPFFNISTLVKQNPVFLKNGEIALPVYNESIGIFSQWLRFDEEGKFVKRYRITSGKDTLQPDIVPVSEEDAFAYMRYWGPPPKCIKVSRTQDGGRHWDVPQCTDLPNPNAAVSALRMDDGTILMAYNPSKHNREAIALAFSKDGIRFHRFATIVKAKVQGDEFSYPYMIQDKNGIHLVYTWKREKIAFATFTAGWVKQRILAASNTPVLIDQELVLDEAETSAKP